MIHIHAIQSRARTVSIVVVHFRTPSRGFLPTTCFIADLMLKRPCSMLYVCVWVEYVARTRVVTCHTVR